MKKCFTPKVTRRRTEQRPETPASATRLKGSRRNDPAYDVLYAYVPRELKTQVKLKAIYLGLTMSEIVEGCVRQWTSGRAAPVHGLGSPVDQAKDHAFLVALLNSGEPFQPEAEVLATVRPATSPTG